ncbi:MAG: thymidine phosphorylase [Calditrichaceae bacterium]
MTPYELISKKRDGFELSNEEITFLVKEFTSGRLPEYQMSAFLMAVYFQEMTDRETMALTRCMMKSGDIVDLSEIPGIKVDKHSTGGVGDKVSIVLAPIVAAAGVPVPMISGRGLGHTGGTLDKLESIPGFRVDYSIKEYKEKISKIGVCMIGQTPNLVPADKKMYALRDVTATIQSIPLITGSIMSKKLAEGIDALVLDVKTGRGAFMQDYDKSEKLAKKLIAVGEQFDKPTSAYITGMHEPLGNRIGNWLEIEECIDALNGNGPEDLMEVTHTLSGTMIFLGGKAKSIEEGISQSKKMIESGRAWNKFLEIVKEQNGDVSYVESTEQRVKTEITAEIKADESGFIQSIDALEIGLTSVSLGAGRQKADDVIDPDAGIILHKKTGEGVEKNETILSFITNNQDVVNSAKNRLREAVQIGSEPLKPEPLIYQRLDKNSLTQR